MPNVAERITAKVPANSHDTMKKLRVLVLATTFPRWQHDTEPRFVFDLTKHLAKNVSLWVLAPHFPGSRMEETMEGVRILRFPYFFPKPLQRLCYDGGILPKLKTSWLARLQLPFFLATQFFHIWKTVRRHNINFIHCHWIIPQGFFVALIQSITSIPYLLTAHGGDVYSFKNIPLIRRFSKLALKRSRMCTVNSESTGKAVREIYGSSRIQVIPMGVDTGQFHPGKYNAELRKDLNIQDLFLLAVGRFAEKKGFRYLLQAMPEILSKKPHAKLVLIGFGPLEKELKHLIEQLNLTEAVLFPGSKSGEELAQYFATADIFIGPSVVTDSGDTEGQGVVFLEAMASETAVIASDVGGIKGIVREGITGLLVPEKDPATIAKKTLLLAENPALRQELAQNGRMVVEAQYSWQITAQRFLDSYREVLDQI